MAIALYPLSAFRAQSAAALKVFKAIREKGTQEPALDSMQTRAELYEFLDYHRYEDMLDEINKKSQAAPEEGSGDKS